LNWWLEIAASTTRRQAIILFFLTSGKRMCQKWDDRLFVSRQRELLSISWPAHGQIVSLVDGSSNGNCEWNYSPSYTETHDTVEIIFQMCSTSM
jgi:hypothetical protein